MMSEETLKGESNDPNTIKISAPTKEELEEYTAFCNLDSSSYIRYLEMRSLSTKKYYIHDVDNLTTEIARCYVTGSYHACITLTNHLLERYTKHLLIVSKSGIKQISDLATLEVRLKPYNDKYSKMNLEPLLKACKSSGLLNEQQLKYMIDMKNQFRNGYSHADASQVFKGAKGGFVLGSFSDSKQSEFSELSYENIPFIQGFAYDGFSEKNALPYFKKVLEFIRSTVHHMIN